MFFLTTSNEFVILILFSILGTIISNELSQLPYVEIRCRYDLTTAVQVCDCEHRDEPFTLPKLTGSNNRIAIENCRRLHIRRDTFSEIVFVNQIRFENINELTLESFAINYSKGTLKIIFDNVNINSIESHALSGNFDSIDFIQCVIDKIQAFAIDSTISSTPSISFTNSRIRRIDSQALKKMTLSRLQFLNTIINEPLAHRAFYQLTINEIFSIVNCSIDVITLRSIDLIDVNSFEMRLNLIHRIDDEAMQFNVNEKISIQRNNFSQIDNKAFSLIKTSETYKRRQSQTMDFHFSSNSIENLKNGFALLTSDDIHLRIFDLRIKKMIDCDEFRSIDSNNFFHQHINSIYFRYKNDYSSIGQLSNECAIDTSTIIAYTLFATPLLLMIIVGGVLLLRYIDQRREARRLEIVMPEGKTYRETQIVMQIENAGLLKTDL